MSLLFAHLEHQVRRAAATLGRTIVEKVTGFSDPTGRQLPPDEPCDWQRDAAGLAKAEDHRGYYEATPTCGQEIAPTVRPDGIWHGCYRDPGHNDLHGCLCGLTWWTPTVPAESSAPEAADSSAGLSWPAWVPVIKEVLGDHIPERRTGASTLRCCSIPGGEAHTYLPDYQGWREHVAPLIAERISALSNPQAQQPK